MEPVFTNAHIERLNQEYEKYILDSSAYIEQKMESCDKERFSTSCPQAPIIKIASIVTGKNDGELFAEGFNELSTDYEVKCYPSKNKSGVNFISVTRTNQVHCEHSGRHFVYDRTSNILECIGGSVKITNLQRDRIEKAFSYIDILKVDSFGGTFAELAERVTDFLMAERQS